MAVGTETNSIQYTVISGNESFSFPYAFFEDTDLLVELDDGTTVTELVLGVDYTVAPIYGTYANGAVITFTDPTWVGTLTITRILPLLQPTDYQDYSNFPADVFESDLDRCVMMIQQVAAENNRSIRGPTTDPNTVDWILPPAADRASQWVGFDAEGDVLVGAPLEGSVPVSTFMKTVLDDADDEAARDTLFVGIEKYDATKTYAANLLVTYQGNIYKSLPGGGGTGNTPDSSPTYWHRYDNYKAYTIESGQTIAAGDVVKLNSGGKIQKYLFVGPSDTSIAANAMGVRMRALDATHVIACYYDTGTTYVMLIAGTVDPVAGTIAWGTAVNALTTGTSNQGGMRICVLTSSSGIMTDGNSAGGNRAVGFTVSGTTVTVGSAVTISTCTGQIGNVEKDTTTTAVWVGSEGTNWRAVVLSLSGTTVTVGTIVTIYASIVPWVTKHVKVSSAYGIWFATASTSGAGGTLYTAAFGVSGTTVTAGITRSWAVEAAQFRPYDCYLINGADEANAISAKVFVHAMGGFGSTSETQRVIANHNGMIMAIMTHGSPLSLYAPMAANMFQHIAEAVHMNSGDNATEIALTPTKRDGIYFALLSTEGIAGTVGYWRRVWMIRITGTEIRAMPLKYINNDSQLIYCEHCSDALDDTTFAFIVGTKTFLLAYSPSSILGIAIDTAGNIVLEGGVYVSSTALTVGAEYYVAMDGTLTTTMSPVRVGKAVSTYELLVGIKHMI